MSNYVIGNRHKQVLIVICVAIAAFMASLDTYIVNVALPTISDYFNVNTSDAALITLTYLILITSTLPILGKIGDRTGFRSIFILGFLLFSLGSLLCGLSPHLHLLVGSRCVQGIGAAMLYAVGMAMVTRYIPDDRQGWAFGITATLAGLGVVVGAPLGGIITQYLSWHWIFLINVPVGIAAIILSYRVLPHDRPAGRDKKPFDIWGALLSFFSLFNLIMAINRGQLFGWNHWGIIALFCSSAILFILFIFREKKCNDPIIDLSIFKISGFTYGSFAGLFAWAAFAGGNFLLPFYLSLNKGLTASLIGSLFLISSFAYILMSPLMGRLSDKTGSRVLCSVGIGCAAAGLLFLSFTLGIQSLVPVILYLAWFGLSMGTFVPPNNNLVLGAPPQELQGTGSAVSRTLQNLGMVLGVAIYETVFSSAIPGGTAAAGNLNTQISPDVLVTGFYNAFLTGAIMCIIACILSIMAREN